MTIWLSLLLGLEGLCSPAREQQGHLLLLQEISA
jgi:hypothetical protein